MSACICFVRLGSFEVPDFVDSTTSDGSGAAITTADADHTGELLDGDGPHSGHHGVRATRSPHPFSSATLLSGLHDGLPAVHLRHTRAGKPVPDPGPGLRLFHAARSGGPRLLRDTVRCYSPRGGRRHHPATWRAAWSSAEGGPVQPAASHGAANIAAEAGSTGAADAPAADHAHEEGTSVDHGRLPRILDSTRAGRDPRRGNSNSVPER